MPSMEVFHNKGCLNPPYARRPAFPDDVQRIALLCCSPINKQTKQQTPEKKKRIVRVMGIGTVVP